LASIIISQVIKRNISNILWNKYMIIGIVQGTFFCMFRASSISVGLSIAVGLILCLEPYGHSLYPIFLKVFINTVHRQSIVFLVFTYVQDCLLIFVNSILSWFPIILFGSLAPLGLLLWQLIMSYQWWPCWYLW